MGGGWKGGEGAAWVGFGTGITWLGAPGGRVLRGARGVGWTRAAVRMHAGVGREWRGFAMAELYVDDFKWEMGPGARRVPLGRFCAAASRHMRFALVDSGVASTNGATPDCLCSGVS